MKDNTNVSIHNLRAIPVAVYNFNSILTEIEKNIIRKLEYLPVKQGPVSLSSSYNILAQHGLLNISHIFDACVSRYLKEILGANVNTKSIGSWATKNTPGSFHHKHYHPNTLLSVVTYFKDSYPDDDSDISNLIFYNNGLGEIFKNFSGFEYEEKIINWNLYNNITYRVKPVEGQVIVFPGHLLHGSEDTFKGTRYCVGSNYFYNDTFGSASGKDTLTVNC